MLHEAEANGETFESQIMLSKPVGPITTRLLGMLLTAWTNQITQFDSQSY